MSMQEGPSAILQGLLVKNGSSKRERWSTTRKVCEAVKDSNDMGVRKEVAVSVSTASEFPSHDDSL
jgi:hypothetical protein